MSDPRGYLEQQCPPCCLFHLAEEDGLADSSRQKTNLAKVGKGGGYMDLWLSLDVFTFELIESSYEEL